MTISPNPFDVCVVLFAFADHPEISKPRPVVVLEVSEREAWIVAAKITSHEPRPWCDGEVVLSDWQEEGLLKPSTVRCSMIARVSLDDIGKTIGHLTERDIQRVVEALAGIDERN